MSKDNTCATVLSESGSSKSDYFWKVNQESHSKAGKAVLILTTNTVPQYLSKKSRTVRSSSRNTCETSTTMRQV